MLWWCKGNWGTSLPLRTQTPRCLCGQAVTCRFEEDAWRELPALFRHYTAGSHQEDLLNSKKQKQLFGGNSPFRLTENIIQYIPQLHVNHPEMCFLIYSCPDSSPVPSHVKSSKFLHRPMAAPSCSHPQGTKPKSLTQGTLFHCEKCLVRQISCH